MLWGNSTDSKWIFLLQKRIIRIMMGSAPRASCQRLVKELGILTVTSQYILSLRRFLVSNLDIYKFNSSVYEMHTRHSQKLYKPNLRLTAYQKSAYHSVIIIYNALPNTLAELVSNKTSFIKQLKTFLNNNPL